jgi:hypothetical protein
MKRQWLLIGILLIVAVFSCKEDKKRIEAETIITEWVGKEIRFPDEGQYQCNFSGKDTTATLCTGLFEKEYKILLYIDSLGCTNCKLHLFEWKWLIEERDSLEMDKLSFLFFFHPKDKKELRFMFKRDRFDYPVFIDEDNNIDRLNHFPTQSQYQCFLLDKDNRVLMVGNPVSNQKIWELYKQTVSGQTQTDATPITSVSIEQSEMEISNLQAGKKSVAIFKLKNTGNKPLLIARVDASCGCTVPAWEKKPIEPGEETAITLEITPEETGFFHKTIRVYCNVEKGVIPLAIKGMTNQELKVKN